jgi:hypothetical protein
MEFFVCPCPATGNVILNGNDQGPNKDGSGCLLTKQCNQGLHTVALKCPAGKTCIPQQVTVVIEKTNPISPMEVAFQCE